MTAVKNSDRRKKRKNRYESNLRVRAANGDEKAARMLDQPRTKAGRGHGRARRS